MLILDCFVVFLITLCSILNVSCMPCVFLDGKYDLSALERPGGWPVSVSVVNGSASRYEINLCHAINSSFSECSNSSVCLISNNSAVSYGNAIDNVKNFAIADNIGRGFSLYVLTEKICKGNGVYRATINFICGPHLGAPELVSNSNCQVHFEWRTSAACHSKPKKEVPCYVLDEQGIKRDLTPLIKDKGGYYVNTPNPTYDFVINVCSELDDSQSKCPPNISACKIVGSNRYSFGSLFSELQYTPEGLLLTYSIDNSSNVSPDCLLKPKTTVLFKCPSRGYSQPPKLISDSNCQYEVEWETEYACPENILKGDIKQCQFTRKSHGVEIDLSPLRSTTWYNVSGNLSYDSFALNVCGGLGNYTCGEKNWKSISVCALNSSGSYIGGLTYSSELSYVDGQVMLKYMKGETCGDGEVTTVINFVCDKNATNNGFGKPTHLYSGNCSHIFQWNTKHACLKHSLDMPCSVTFDKKTVNLQKLLITSGEAWEAIDFHNFEKSEEAEYFINVCGQVSHLSNLSRCGEGSSICILHNGQYINLGNFTSPPKYEELSNSIWLHYTGGSSCKDDKFWHSSIEFICKPGRISSEPVLAKYDEDDCHYIFEWHTAEACPVGLIEGSNCKVFNSDLGINYDLTPLKSKVYTIESKLYKFYVGVCEPVKDSPCSKKTDSAQTVGVCQVDKLSKNSWKTGEPTSRLSYADGVVNLTYLSGDPYNDPNSTSRMTMIIFICDYNAGNGVPHFVEEVNYAYIFHWYTDLVCPPSATPECIVHDPINHLNYDLSVLSLSRENYQTIFREGNKERLIYLNVCQPLKSPNICDPTAAACIVEQDVNGKEKSVVSNLGKSYDLTFESPGHLSLRYTNGDSCMAFGQNTTYSTVIHFLCTDTLSETGMKFLSKVGNCEYAFLWSTKAACPANNSVVEQKCEFTDPDSGFTYDLTPLYKMKGPYTVSTPIGNFQLNICGKVSHGCLTSDGKEPTKNVSVCKVDEDNNLISNIAVSDGYTLNYSPEQYLNIIYKAENGQQEVVIRFPCGNTFSDPDPKLIHYDDNQLVFEVTTHLTCAAPHFNCNAIDKNGHEYDLGSLAKYYGNWEVPDLSRAGLRYHINFCRPLTKMPSYKCPGGASLSCQTDVNNPEAVGHDLGSQMEELKVSDSGTIVIRYTNGSFCHNGQFKRSTTINLFCSDTVGELIFLGETEECEYVFSLDTFAACPLTSSASHNCIAKDLVYGYMFDLNPLKSKNSSYNVKVGEYSYAFNVCDKLSGFDNECTNSSACQLKQSDEKFAKSLGLPSDVLVYYKGLITLEYKSGSGNCHGMYNRSTKITFTCHHAHEDKDGPIFVAEAQDCTYLFEWPTVHACPPFDVIECSVVDNNGVYYDLSKLSLPNDNYYVKYPSSDEMFVINVCRSIVHTPNSLCPYTSGSCLISSDLSKRINLGRVSQAPYVEDGKIKILYTSGDMCRTDGVAKFMQTLIEFNCDPSLLDSEPIFVGEDDCTYYFEWNTAYACPTNSFLINSNTNCTVKNPVTGYLYNLSYLKDHGPFKFHSKDHDYYLNICTDNNSTSCGPEVGMCQEEIEGKRHWIGGRINSNLTYDDGILILNYTDGDKCHSNRFERNTIIEFHCGPGIGEPYLLHESYDCTYFFKWTTELACESLVHCAVRNGSIYYDLTTLAQTYYTAASSIPDDNASYYISLCGSLPQIPDAYCPPGSSICRIHKNPTSVITESLGKIDQSPFIDFMGHATILYTNGSVCNRNPKDQNKARIIFDCDAEAGMGEPVLVDKDDCLYLFLWKTSIVCPENPEKTLFSSCNYTDNSRGIHFDLLPLQKTGGQFNYEVIEQNTSFQINICGALNINNTKCKNAGICSKVGNEWQSYGVAETQRFTYNGKRLRLTFFDGDDCPSGLNSKRMSEIFFVCDPSAGLGQPILHKKYSCLAVFMWKTSLVCRNVQQKCAFDIDEKHYDFNMLSSLTHNWPSTKNGNLYWINLCRGILPVGDTLGCSPSAAVCMKDKNGLITNLGMAQTMQFKSLNTSDLMLTFSDGDSRACESLHSSVSLHPVVRIFMQCESSLGQPVMVSGPDTECFYDFTWQTYLACPDLAEDVLLEKDGIISDVKKNLTFDISDILNRTFVIPGNSTKDHYVYKMNLSGFGNASNPSSKSNCAKAAVCQTKPDSDFDRDIGSLQTRKFVLRGSELKLTFESVTRPCGKNPLKNVTTILDMVCVSAAGIGSPEFMYESGDCDYLFKWDTIVVCPEFHRRGHRKNESNPAPYTEPPTSSHTAELVVGIIFALTAAAIILFIVVKAERRAIISSRIRGLFGRVNFPYFQYKRGDILTELQSDF